MNGEQLINASNQRVWDALNDPDVLKRSIAGCQSLEREGEARMRATVAIKIGPMDARLAGVITLSERDPPNAYTIIGEGQGPTGSARGAAKVRLVEDAGATVLHYEVDAQVGGRLAQLGGPIIDATAKQLAANFFKRFGEIVAPPAPAVASASSAERAAAEAPAVAAPAPTLPVIWCIAVIAAALVGFLIGQTPATQRGFAWTVLTAGLFIIVAVAMAFDAGRRSAAPVILQDPALLEILRQSVRKL